MVKKSMILDKVKSNGHASETEEALTQKQVELKEKRARACWDKIEKILAEDKCELEPRMTITANGATGSISIIAK